MKPAKKTKLFISHFSKKKENNKQQKQKKKENQQDTSNDLDWFKEYPVTDSMKNNTKLNNPIAQQLLTFIKPYLIDIYPGKIIRQASDKTPESKINYKYLVKTLAGKRPKFLTDLIYEANPSIDKSISIPFELIHSTFIALLQEFTTTLFTQLNYPKIFASYSSIPPYTTINRKQIALNLARLHLILHDKYKTIHAEKFYEDLKLYPIYFKLHYNISEDNINQPLFKIQNDAKFNI